MKIQSSAKSGLLGDSRGVPLPCHPAWLRCLWSLGRCYKALQVSSSSSLSPIITTTITIGKIMSPSPYKYTIKGSVLCRFVKDPVLWACLAGLAVHSKHLDTAEVAYAAIQEADKVVF